MKYLHYLTMDFYKLKHIEIYVLSQSRFKVITWIILSFNK
jgi:hypothetical protein